MKAVLRVAAFLALVALTATPARSAIASASPITAEGQRLAEALDRMDVEHHWLAGRPVKWRTGEPLRNPAADGRSHTHCSAFVATAAEKLGVYILRPPQHASALLANAQYDWLAEQGRREGWTPVTTAHEAQRLANEGQLVVAVFKESDPQKPGHIAIVRPSDKSEAKLCEEGPQIIQAGRNNHASTSVKDGFRHHKGAYRDGLIRFYAHPISSKAP